jgi:hypothetical protein
MPENEWKERADAALVVTLLFFLFLVFFIVLVTGGPQA